MTEKPLNKIDPSFWLSLFFVIIICIWIVAAAQWGWDTRLFPWAIGIPTLGLALWQLVRDWRNQPAQAANKEGDNSRPQAIMDIAVDASISPEETFRHTIKNAGWIVGFGAGIWFFGFLISIPIFIFFYLIYQAKASKLSAFIVTGLTYLFVWAMFDQLMHMAWPEGAVFIWLGY